MTRYVALRLLRGLGTLWGVLTIAFFLLRLEGSPAALLLPLNATPAQVLQLNRALGFNRPLPIQYEKFLVQAIQGNLGNSLQQGTSAVGLVLSRMPATLELALSGFLFGTGTAFIFAITIQLTASERLRRVLLWIGTLRQAVPTFLFGILMDFVFSVSLHWLPADGIGGLSHLLLPMITVGTFEFTLYVRLLDSSFSDQRSLDYTRTAYAKGQGRAGVVFRHQLPNALLPILTVAALNLGALLGGAVVIETVFNWPGAGLLIVQAVGARDFPVVEAGLLVGSVAFIGVNIFVDMLYTFVDPRVRLR
jgi:peptide/nickel transport system permease protein